jgi:hypothetical protein
MAGGNHISLDKGWLARRSPKGRVIVYPGRAKSRLFRYARRGEGGPEMVVYDARRGSPLRTMILVGAVVHERAVMRDAAISLARCGALWAVLGPETAARSVGPALEATVQSP